MNDRELTYVKTIAEERSISAAARKLFIAQPSLSQSLHRIEESLGASLFDRVPGGLRLTPTGEKYLQMANQVLKLYDDLKSDIADLDALAAGTVTFGITRLLGRLLLPEALPQFYQKYPNIRLNVVEGNSKELDRALTACEISFAVMHRLVEDSNHHIDYNVFLKDPFIVTVSGNSPLLEKAVERPGYPYPVINIRDVAAEPLITVPYGQRIRQVLDTVFMQERIRPNIILETRVYSTAQGLAARGMGCTIGPQSYTPLCDFTGTDVRFLSLDDKLDAAWFLCLATFKNGSLSRADRMLESYFEKAIERAVAG